MKQSLLEELDQVIKSVKGSEKPGHKYLKRKPKAGGRFQYVYANTWTGGKEGKLRVNANMRPHYRTLNNLAFNMGVEQDKRGVVPTVKQWKNAAYRQGHLALDTLDERRKPYREGDVFEHAFIKHAIEHGHLREA